tara:strand:- start:4030 stop:4203 length:174 start_codon:yes stop_codon:yes gene_type:complete
MKTTPKYLLVALLIIVVLSTYFINYKTEQSLISTTLIVGISLLMPWLIMKRFSKKEG